MYNNCAFCTLVMRDANYALGAIALARSLLETNTACPNFICLVTRDIDEAVCNRLSMYWKLVYVDYLTVKKHPLKSKRIEFLYGNWISDACTKLQFLDLLDAPNGYEQIIYIDADSCVLKNIDHLFFQESSEKAGVAYQAKICLFSCFQQINHRIAKNNVTYIVNAKERDYYQNRQIDLSVPIKELKRVWREAINGKCHNQFLLSGAVMVWKKTRHVRPKKPISERVIANVNSSHNVIFSGHKSLFYNGWDEQILMQSILDAEHDITIEHLPFCYCWSSGFYYALPANVQPYIMTFWGLKKPWYFDKDTPVTYMDVYIWRYFYGVSAASASPSLPVSGREDIRELSCISTK